VVGRVEKLAPGFTDSILHRQVIGPWQMENTYGLVGGNIFHGELSPSQLFPRAASPPAMPISALRSRVCIRLARRRTAAAG